MSRLDLFSARIEVELVAAKRLATRRTEGEDIEDFDIRGGLYAIGMELAPSARADDIAAMREWLRLRGNETVVDIAAGGGFLTRHIGNWTAGRVVAIDPSARQLDCLAHACGDRIAIIVGSPDDPALLRGIETETIDVVTSFGGLHHVNDQRVMMEQVARALKPGGRFVAADVCEGTALARHFDEVTAVKSITGHVATWLSVDRLRELIDGLPLRLTKAEMVPLKWTFASEREMAVFFKGFHAYDQCEAEILEDLQRVLRYEGTKKGIALNWEMLFFEMMRA